MSGSHFVPRRFVMGEFANSDALLVGVRQVREAGHNKVDSHTPYPVHGMEDALGLGGPMIPRIVLLGALAGIISALALMIYTNHIDFPINIANRPSLSPPSFVPITFELAVLLGGTSSFFGVLALMKLPQPYHPVFEWDHYTERSIDGFFLSVEIDGAEDGQKVLDEVKAAGAVETKLIEESER